jgi:hypothetical protein
VWGQLDEIGYQVHIKSSVMRIKDPEGRLLAKIPWAHNRLYVLNDDIA